MEKIKEIYEQFNSITKSYIGKETDWRAKHDELERLYVKITKLRLPWSKNVIFYEWMKMKLKEDINTELNRIWKLALKMSR